MTPHPPDGSRDNRIEDPTNLWIIHPAARALLPWCISHRISANAVSVTGLCIGTCAAAAYTQWEAWPFACAGLLLCVAWLVADGLDGMVARATGTASPLGRFLDGLCDHGVFILIYVALASSLGTREAWILAVAAGALHGLQANLYESERARFHRRCKGLSGEVQSRSDNPLVRGYDRIPRFIDRIAHRFDDTMRHGSDPLQLGAAYGAQATRPMRFMSLLSANVRVYAIFVACIAGNPRLFWWLELVPLTAILIIGLAWHRAVEYRLIKSMGLAQTSRAAHDLPTRRT